MAYIGREPLGGEVVILDSIESQFNGVATSFDLTRTDGGVTSSFYPVSSSQLLVSLGGVIQKPDPTGDTGFKINFNQIVFAVAPLAGTSCFIVSYGNLTNIGAPSDGSVTPNKLSTGGIYWNTSGDVGIGTTNPSSELQVVGTITATTFVGALTGNAATVTNGVYTSGNQTIGDTKTFSGTIILNNSGVINALQLGNNNITGVNNIVIADPGVNEGIEWAGGNLWKIYESPNNLTNAGGNLQIVQNTTRRATFNTSGQLEIPVATGTAPFVVASTTRVDNLNAATAGNADTVTNGVYTSGNQTIAGSKTFSSAISVPQNINTTGGGINFNGAGTGSAFIRGRNQDGASNTLSNLQLQSWFGIGFGPSISNQTVPVGENAFWINVRDGSWASRGAGTVSSTLSLGTQATTTSHAVRADRSITINGTTNQITSSAGAQDLTANRTWTLSLPQDIHTAATPTFAGGTFNGTVETSLNASGTLDGEVLLQRIRSNAGANNVFFDIKSIRHTTGSTWTGVGFRLQHQVDSTQMGFIEFNSIDNSRNLVLGTDGSTRLLITRTGNVGIGTSSPSASLHVEGNAFFGSITDNTTDTKKITVESRGFAALDLIGDRSNAGGEPGGSSILLSQDGGLVSALIGICQGANQNGRGGTYTGTTDNSVYLGHLHNSSLHLGTNSQVRFTINGAGNVGIGQTLPTAPLHISYSTASVWTSTNILNGGTNNNINAITISNTESSITDPEASIFLSAGSSAVAQHSIAVKRTGSETGDLIFRRRNGTNSAESLRVTTSGNVGIGTASPLTKLQVNDTITVVGANAFLLKTNYSSNATVIHRNDSSAYYILLSNASTSPTSSFNSLRPLSITHATGSVSISTELRLPTQTIFRSPGAAASTEINAIHYSGLGGGTLSFEGTAGQLFSISNSFSDPLFTVSDVSGIPSIEVNANGTVELAPFGGNVGIGITNPVNKVDISGSLGRGAPVTETANFTVTDTENWIICNGTGTITVTLPTASSWTGREIMIKTIAAQSVVSASSNVIPLAGGSAGTAILANVAGRWATLVSDGTNWIIMQSN